MTISFRKCHALLPTAGIGSRLGLISDANLPKQFRNMGGKPMLEYALNAFINTPMVSSIWVGVSPNFENHPIIGQISHHVNSDKPLKFLPTGGATRQETVKNTLAAMLSAGISESDWVLVHDAARPGISPSLVEKLIISVNRERELSNSDIGGLLAMPVADTLKQADLGSVAANTYTRALKTIPRNHLWHAQTPQMFSLQSLHDALNNAILSDADVTDEASAMERMGMKPLLIEGATSNFKVTHPEDWNLMQILLELPTAKKT